MSNIFEHLWVEKFRPTKLEDVVLSDKNRRYFESIKIKGEIPHLLFSGSPGIGKSCCAKIIVNELLDCQYLYINASDESGVDTIRTKVKNFAQTLSIDGKLKCVILDELDGTSSIKTSGGTSAQQALRNIIEEYAENTRFIATCNYPSMVIDALRSRFQEFDLTPPFDQVAKRVVHILKTQNVTVKEEDRIKLEQLIKKNYPDIRKTIGLLQKNTVNGVLHIDFVENNIDFAKKLLNYILQKETPEKIREYIIKNEINFGNDYHSLLKSLFEAVYQSDIVSDKKRSLLLVVSQAMYQHQFVLDKEINSFSCILELLGLG